jgi:ABC-type transporter Mla subunit MlaD
MYIDLNPGSATAPPLEGEIPIARTSGQVDWDQFNNQLPTATRPQMQRQLRGLDMALRQPIIEGRTLAVIGPSLSTVGMSSSALRGEIPGDLTRMVQSTAATLRALSVSTTSLQTLVNDGDRTLAVTAGHRAALSSTIELSPAAESASITGNAILVRTLNALDPLVHRLRPGARLLGPATTALMPILSRTRQTLADARPVLSLLGPTVQRLGAAARQGTPLIGALTPTVLRLRTQLIPFLNTTDPDTRLKLYEALGPTASSLSSSQSGFDSNGFVYNFDVQVSTGSVELPCNTGLDGVAHASQCLTSVAPFAAAERKALAGAHR